MIPATLTPTLHSNTSPRTIRKRLKLKPLITTQTTEIGTQYGGEEIEKLARKRFHLGEVIGAGKFGKVFRVTIPVQTDPSARAPTYFDSGLVLKLFTSRNPSDGEELISLFPNSPYVVRGKAFIYYIPSTKKLSLSRTNNAILAGVLMENGGLSLKNQRFSLNQKKDLAKQLLKAVALLREKRVVHRDIKPNNILVKDGKLCLCDFGIAKKLEWDEPLYSPKGTESYRAPESIGHKGYNYSFDDFSCALTIYFLFEGKSLIKNTPQLLTLDPESIVFTKTPNDYQAIIRKMLHNNPSERMWAKRALLELEENLTEENLTTPPLCTIYSPIFSPASCSSTNTELDANFPPPFNLNSCITTDQEDTATANI